MKAHKRSTGTLVATRPKGAVNPQTFADNFEGVIGTNWPSITGAVVTTAGSAHTGAAGVNFSPANTAKTIGTSTGKWAQTHSWFALGLYVRFASFATGGTNPSTEILTLANTNSLDNVDLYLNQPGNFWTLDVKDADKVITTVAPALNTWYHVQIKGHFGPGGTWVATLKVDGVDLCTPISVGESNFAVRSLVLGCTATTKTYSMDADDLHLTVADSDPGWVA